MDDQFPGLSMIEGPLTRVDDIYVLFRHLDSIIQLDRGIAMKVSPQKVSPFPGPYCLTRFPSLDST